MKLSRSTIVCSFLYLLCLAAPLSAIAHPMGNFSINHYARIEVKSDGIPIRYIVDYAEIPTVSERDAMGAKSEESISSANQSAYLTSASNRLRDGLSLQIDGSTVPLQIASKTLVFVPGAGGLPTMRITINLTTPHLTLLRPSGSTVAYRDDNYPSRTGWKEIVAFADSAMRLEHSDASHVDTSKQLTSYPTDATIAPLQQTNANLSVVSNTSPANDTRVNSALPPTTDQTSSQSSVIALPKPDSLQVSGSTSASTPQDLFTQSISRKNLSGGVIVLSLLIAFVFGALHALSPGHGKAMMAAYLVGSRGVAWHAVVLGLVVTLTHTAGVFALGMVILYAAKNVTPDRLYPVLSGLSGLTIAGIGLLLLRQRYRGLSSGTHVENEDDGWAGSEQEMDSYGATSELSSSTSSIQWRSESRGPHTLRSLVALGITGGLIPCPSALVVLLSAVGLHRVAFGLGLIVSFSLGLAIVLMAIGLCVVYTRGLSERLSLKRDWLARLPVLSAGIVTLIGMFLLIGAFMGKGY